MVALFRIRFRAMTQTRFVFRIRVTVKVSVMGIILPWPLMLSVFFVN